MQKDEEVTRYMHNKEAYLFLLRSFIGIAPLLYPNFVKTFGFLAVGVLTLLFASLSALSLRILTELTVRYKRGVRLRSLAEDAYRPLGVLTDVLLLFKSICTCTVSIAQSHTIIGELVAGRIGDKWALVARTALFVPLSMIRTTKTLKPVCAIGIMSIVTVLLCNFIYMLKNGAKNYTTLGIYTSEFRTTLPKKLGSMVYGFNAHHNYLTMRGEIENRSLENITNVLLYTIVSVVSFYLLSGYLGAKAFGDDTEGDILKCYTRIFEEGLFSAVLSVIVKIVVFFNLIMMVPMQVIAGRDAIFSVVPAFNRYKTSDSAHVITTILYLMCSGLLVFLLKNNVEDITRLTACIVSAPLMFVLPGVLYAIKGPRSAVKRMLISSVLIVPGTLLVPLGIYNFINS